jgi:hypothetical protein
MIGRREARNGGDRAAKGGGLERGILTGWVVKSLFLLLVIVIFLLQYSMV